MMSKATMGPKKAPAAKSTTTTKTGNSSKLSTNKTATSKAIAKTTGPTAAKTSDKTAAKTKNDADSVPEKAVEPEPVRKVVEKPPVHTFPIKALAAQLFDDCDGIIKESKWWPYCIDTKDIAGRFMLVRHVNVINGLDQNAMSADRIRMALLGAIRFGKPFVFDMMGADLYNPLEKIFDEILPGLMTMVLDKSILKDDNFMKLVKDSDSEEYHNKWEYDSHLERFVFVVLNNVEGPTGFTDKMMTINFQ